MKTQSIVASSLIIFVCATLAAQTTRTIFEGRPATLRLSPHLTTTIRLPEPVNSVIVGDPSSLSGGVLSRRTPACICETDHANG